MNLEKLTSTQISHKTSSDSNSHVLAPFPLDCYRYQKVVSSSPVALRGPDTQRPFCLWHLQTAPGSQLELHMEWLLPECRDRLVVYNSLTPTDTHLITSWVSSRVIQIYLFAITYQANICPLLHIWCDGLSASVSHCITYLHLNFSLERSHTNNLSSCPPSVYGCSRHERVVRVLSSGDWMTVVWKQGLYNYKDPFSLSAQARDRQGKTTWSFKLKVLLKLMGMSLVWQVNISS